jgi:hypothetical protein
VLTESEIGIAIQSNQGKAEYQRALQQAAQIRALAEAEAERIARTGIAQAMAIDEQVRAYGGPRFQVTQQVMSRFAEAVERAQIDVVPRVLITGDGREGGHTGGSGSVFEALLTMLLAERVGEPVSEERPRSPEIEALWTKIQAGLGQPAVIPEMSVPTPAPAPAAPTAQASLTPPTAPTPPASPTAQAPTPPAAPRPQTGDRPVAPTPRTRS